jgi:hypothetical protein
MAISGMMAFEFRLDAPDGSDSFTWQFITLPIKASAQAQLASYANWSDRAFASIAIVEVRNILGDVKTFPGATKPDSVRVMEEDKMIAMTFEMTANDATAWYVIQIFFLSEPIL